MIKKKEKKINFDDYADNYKVLFTKKLSFFDNDPEYFDFYKIKILKKIIPDCKNILDYGCGIGSSIKNLKKFYPKCNIYAYDTSKQSLNILKKKHPFVKIIEPEKIKEKNIDLVFLAGVLHHIEKKDRKKFLTNIGKKIKNKKNIIIFEHNPYNFMTKKIVSSCSFDEGLELLTLKETSKLLKQSDFKIKHNAYTLFFPSSFKFLRKYEHFLNKIPFGGQYYIFAEKL